MPKANPLLFASDELPEDVYVAFFTYNSSMSGDAYDYLPDHVSKTRNRHFAHYVPVSKIGKLEDRISNMEVAWSKSDKARNADHVKVMAAATKKRSALEGSLKKTREELLDISHRLSNVEGTGMTAAAVELLVEEIDKTLTEVNGAVIEAQDA